MPSSPKENVEIAYSDTGSGVPLVLIHAFPTDRELWKPQVDTISQDYRVIAVDLRGFGESPPTDGQAVSIDRYADDVIDLLDRLNVSSAVHAGLSLGGYVALSIALRHPDRLRGLVLANTRAGPDNDEGKRQRAAMAAKVEESGPEAVLAAFGDKLLADTGEREREQIRKLILRQRRSGIVSALRGMAERPDRSHEIERISAPTLIISGTADSLIPSSESAAMQKRIAGSRFIDIAGAAHFSNVDHPREFNRATTAFLAQLP